MLNQNTTAEPILISGGSDDSNWDFAAVTSYLIDSTQQGVLIVDGDIDDSVQDNESVGGNGNSDNDLSYPDSIPTEIGSLQDSHVQYSKWRRIRMLVIFVMFSVPTIASAFLVYDRQQLLQRNLELEREILHMKEIAASAIVVSHQGTSARQGLFDRHKEHGEESSNSDWKFKLIDNCWFKAEVELRECASEAKDSFADTAEKFYDYFAGSANRNTKGDDDEHDNGSDNYCALAAFTTDASETAIAAASKVMDSVWSMWSEGWGAPVLLDAMEQTRDAIRDALPDQLIFSKQD